MSKYRPNEHARKPCGIGLSHAVRTDYCNLDHAMQNMSEITMLVACARRQTQRTHCVSPIALLIINYDHTRACIRRDRKRLSLSDDGMRYISAYAALHIDSIVAGQMIFVI